ncbi:hypothetical protein, partial [Bradyrhizobium sp. 33ap4]|uniref:hypothetical protein n=1 Tax=Bradyrhizobium sp. 33ap4 TaxID=3061630 RepID=UPI00292DF85B
MELEGLKRGLSYLRDADINVTTLVTDRHCQIRKYIENNYPDMAHQFDCWHVAKGKAKFISLACTAVTCMSSCMHHAAPS